jgi:hypothetical protein
VVILYGMPLAGRMVVASLWMVPISTGLAWPSEITSMILGIEVSTVVDSADAGSRWLVHALDTRIGKCISSLHFAQSARITRLVLASLALFPHKLIDFIWRWHNSNIPIAVERGVCRRGRP